MSESVSVQLSKILDEYDEHVQDVTNSVFKTAARTAANDLKNSSPRRTGGYASGWSVKNLDRHGKIANLIVHNSTHYQLTHLLENGHVVRNKKGTYGRAPARKHIAPVADRANSEVPQEIERQL